VSLDPERHEVMIRNLLVQLPLKEFELLGLLLENAGRVLLVQGEDAGPHPGDADRPGVGSGLRGRHQDPRRAHQAAAGKVESDPSNPTRIVTIRGLGYKFEVPRDTSAAS
jgi:two-component system response regulator RegX3